MLTKTLYYNIYFLLHKDEPPRFPNIGYVGSTYNIFKGNPRSTKGLDPGFTLRNLFQFVYHGGNITADGRYSIPDNTQAHSSSSCTFDFLSETNQNIASYFNSLQIDASADFRGWGASFSASADYKEIHQSSSSHESTYVSSTATCEAYVASVQLEAASLNPAFANAVQDLPPQPVDLTDYLDFIHEWGTHTATQLRMGGRYGVQSAITSDSYTNMVSTGLDIKAAAKYSGLISLNANVGTDDEKDAAEAFESFRRDYQIYQIGGKPPINESASAFDWARTVKDNPLPLKYNLLPLTNYLTSRYFPNDKDISKKQSNLQEAAVEYCQIIEVTDINYCVNNGPTSTPKIEVLFTNAYTELPCGLPDGDFFVPVINNPHYRILGTLRRYSSRQDATVLVNSEIAPKELIREAKDWVRKYFRPEGNASIFSPICDIGFSSVSDFFCCGDSVACLKELPIALPCIANHCLASCGFFAKDHRNSDINAIMPGNGVLGNDILHTSHHFIRYNSEIHPPDKFMCLNFDCLTFTTFTFI